jgi:type IV pilus assembly protein PilF
MSSPKTACRYRTLRRMFSHWAMISAASLSILSGCVTQSTQVENKLPDKPSNADARTRAEAHTRLGSAYFNERKIAVALEEARMALKDDGTYAPAHNLMGLINMEIGEHTQARAAFEEGVRLAPNDTDLANNYGWFECTHGDAKRGIELLTRAQRDPLYPAPAKPLLNLGLCQHKLGNFAAAEEHLRRVLMMQPELPIAMLRMAEISLAKRDLRQADAYIGRVLLTSQPTPETLLLAVKIARAEGDRSRETTYVAQLRRRFPDSAEARVALESR